MGNIHIRYEDDVSHPGHPFAAGFTLRGLDAHTTDEQWQPAYVPGMPIKVHKLASLNALSVYWNPVRWQRRKDVGGGGGAGEREERRERSAATELQKRRL